jgi:hypothetical protein
LSELVIGLLWIGVTTRAFDLKIVSKPAKPRKPLVVVEKFVMRCRLRRVGVR